MSIAHKVATGIPASITSITVKDVINTLNPKQKSMFESAVHGSEMITRPGYYLTFSGEEEYPLYKTQSTVRYWIIDCVLYHRGLITPKNKFNKLSDATKRELIDIYNDKEKTSKAVLQLVKQAHLPNSKENRGFIFRDMEQFVNICIKNEMSVFHALQIIRLKKYSLNIFGTVV